MKLTQVILSTYVDIFNIKSGGNFRKLAWLKQVSKVSHACDGSGSSRKLLAGRDKTPLSRSRHKPSSGAAPATTAAAAAEPNEFRE